APQVGELAGATAAQVPDPQYVRDGFTTAIGIAQAVNSRIGLHHPEVRFAGNRVVRLARAVRAPCPLEDGTRDGARCSRHGRSVQDALAVVLEEVGISGANASRVPEAVRGHRIAIVA